MNCKSDQCSDDELFGATSNNEAQTQSSSATSNGQLNSSGAEMSKAELRKVIATWFLFLFCCILIINTC